ncbi:class I SAM-dependent methyltransferase [Micromonospora aurantiaca (nom. illeg.)]|uniref:class I SAM-dependent methyltransferase n=1 Tax=Micromonospora aurantiaca (nom. illeg.) TaxID=47850 RepID=UPI00082900A9|nr:class I SAM-dependent methyltransferase [Micromonospora aurantiaca]SCL36108.1 Methyltransferase domain-containing protein [Micromonospora aurantiaca]
MSISRADRLTHLWEVSAQPYHRHTREHPSHRQITALLISTLTTEPTRVLDFGCGPGNSTRVLRRQLPDAHLVGLDTAPAMINIAEQATPAEAKIEYRCQDITTDRTDEPRDLIVCSNSFFHIDDKQTLLAELDRLLTPDGTIVFSLYDTVFRPDTTPRWPLEQPSPGPCPDPLMDLLVAELRRRGHDITTRSEDRQILTDDSLSALFTGCGMAVRCAGTLRLVRDTTERVSFLRIPAVAAEVFPNIPHETVGDALNALDLTSPLPPRTRTVYAFTATREQP